MMKKNCGKKIILLCTFLFFSLPVFSAGKFFWNPSLRITDVESVYPKTAGNSKETYTFWQEVDKEKELIWLSCRYLDENWEWKENKRFAGPFEYSGSEIPDLYSVTMTANGKIAAAVQASDKLISIFISSDRAKTFIKSDIEVEKADIFAPRIYSTRSNKFVLFVSKSKVSNPALRLHEFYIYHATSDDGLKWSSFSETFSDSAMPNSFAPFLCSTNSSEYLVFQYQFSQNKKNTYQLYVSHSENNGKSWSLPVHVTNDDSLIRGDFSDYDNQAPFLYWWNNSLHLVWERKARGTENSEIWYEQITKDGPLADSCDLISSKGKSRKAGLFSYKNDLYAYWVDNRKGYNQVNFAVKEAAGWTEKQLSPAKTDSSFPVPVFNKDELRFVWQDTDSKSNNRIVFLNPDKEVSKALITAERLKAGTRSASKKVSFKIKLPEDISGIDGYIYSWSQDKNQIPDINSGKLQNNTTLKLTSEEEGDWYLSVKVKDIAGNWSELSTFDYYLDLTPPKAVVFENLELDQAGFLSSNYGIVRWKSDSSDTDVVSYKYKLTQITNIPFRYCSTPSHKNKLSQEELKNYAAILLKESENKIKKTYKLSDNVIKTSYFNFSNQVNGLYVLTVAAVDSVGYTGPAVTIPVLLNKYIPHTYISGIKTSVTASGEVLLDISGNDFAYDGRVTSILIDSDGKKPYDLVITRNAQDFTLTNNKISGLNLGRDIDEGLYYVGVIHSDRGLYMTRTKALRIDANGTVQIENDYEYLPAWKSVSKNYKHKVFAGYLVLVTALFLAIIGVFVFGISFLRNYADLVSTRKILKQLERGALMPQYQKSKEEEKRRNGSLKTSLAGFAISLVVAIILVISLSLGIMMIKEQERTLSKGLHDRVNVLLTSVFTGARTYLQNAEESSMEFNDLLNQMSSLSEAEFLTITGALSENAVDKKTENSLLHVWASNDSEISGKVNKLSTRKTIIPGISVLNEELDSEQEIARRCVVLDEEALAECGEITLKISELNQELLTASQSRRLEISNLNAGYRSEIQKKLLEISEKGSGSIPEYSDEKFNRNVTEYLFYRPVLYSQGTSNKYVHGILFLKVNTESLIRDIENATKSILIIVLIISVFTIVLGIFVANLFASRIVKPIKMLEKTVTEISEENDKERLLAGDITDLPNNEIGRLGDSVNRMKKDLGYNERELNLQANEATPIQQSMVSLESLSGNFKQNISRISDKNISEFAYYKGASGASGDYFDFKKLDDRWYVLIKCDASGHAAPAGILVTMVATLYKKYFEKWSYVKNGTKLDEFVYMVNDFLESLNIKGKFVAMIICLYDSKTGNLYMCHAGDRLVRLYDNSSQVLNKIELVETPAAGPFPSFMLQMKGGFKVEEANLKEKDKLLLYTDGIEENGRVMRTPDFQAIMKPKTDSSGVQIVDEYGNLQYEAEKEEFGEERVRDIVKAVFQKKKYILKKTDNPSIGEVLEFDFTNCQGTVEECILALSSIEKVFRLYKPDTATIKDLVEVDRAIDGFLKDHFSLYTEYAVPPTDESFNGRPVRNPKNPNNVFYAFMKEDVQDDDLTMVCLERN